MRWEKLQQQVHSQGGAQQRQQEEGGGVSGPGKRWGHTCNAIKDGRFLYVFGGYGKDNCQTNQVHVFDTATQTWSQPVIKGTPPTPRDSHSCTTVGDNLYVFGGTDGMNPLKDLHILDTSSHTWISPSFRGEGPEAREGHNAALIGKRLFIFGGCGKSSSNNDEVYYNDLYILNTETFVWKHAATSGTPPSPRDSHTCSSWKNNVIVIGGEDGHDYYLSDVHILDTDTLVWRELNTSGQLLTPRAGHSTVAFGKKLFVFGGFTDAQNLYNDLYVLDIDTGVWTKVTTVGDGPSARFSVAGDCLDPQKRGVLVFLGGCNKSLEALDDMFYLHTGITRESEQRLEKLSLRKQLKLKCQEQNLTPIQDKALVRVGVGANMCQPSTVPVYGQACVQNISLVQSQSFQGKKTFQAKVTERISDGYAIETCIDGKPLRGILFSSRPDYHHKAIPNPSRKRIAAETGGVMSNGDYNSKTKSSKVLKQDVADQKKVVNVQEKESTSHELQSEGAAVPISKDQAPSDTSQRNKVTSDAELLVTPLNLGNEEPNSELKLNSEIPGEDRKNSPPNDNNEILRENLSAPANNTDPMSLDPDDKTLISGQNEATTSIQN
ncbi:BTB-kelch protein [Trema orientale]|uniref:BTB-kelch protein n=1 Tax=Trema orientale TaxID=63057 RepID=A0A2P5D8T8_TREOI|nr:BTB-kelch protein [Trema orientale]